MVLDLPSLGTRWQGGSSKNPPHSPTLWNVIGYRHDSEWDGRGWGVVLERVDDQARSQPPGSTQIVSVQVFQGHQHSPSVRATYQPWQITG
jgi:hypothetical protein